MSFWSKILFGGHAIFKMIFLIIAAKNPLFFDKSILNSIIKDNSCILLFSNIQSRSWFVIKMLFSKHVLIKKSLLVKLSLFAETFFDTEVNIKY